MKVQFRIFVIEMMDQNELNSMTQSEIALDLTTVLFEIDLLKLYIYVSN